MLVLAERIPLIAYPAPRPLPASAVTLPAVPTRSYGFRVRVGNSRICLLSTTVDSCWSVVLTSTPPAAATTLTLAATAWVESLVNGDLSTHRHLHPLCVFGKLS